MKKNQRARNLPADAKHACRMEFIHRIVRFTICQRSPMGNAHAVTKSGNECLTSQNLRGDILDEVPERRYL
jgi:hypothetical protein